MVTCRGECFDVVAPVSALQPQNVNQVQTVRQPDKSKFQFSSTPKTDVAGVSTPELTDNGYLQGWRH
jgi:hypothetical protein